MHVRWFLEPWYGKVPDRTTVVVSIFTDDSVSSWNSDSADDLNTMEDSLDYVGIACDWISESSKNTGMMRSLSMTGRKMQTWDIQLMWTAIL